MIDGVYVCMFVCVCDFADKNESRWVVSRFQSLCLSLCLPIISWWCE